MVSGRGVGTLLGLRSGCTCRKVLPDSQQPPALALAPAAAGEGRVKRVCEYTCDPGRGRGGACEFASSRRCGHCQRLAPEYEQAARELAPEGIPLAKVDASEQKELTNRFNVQGFPTMKVFHNGTPYDYEGPRQAAGSVYVCVCTCVTSNP